MGFFSEDRANELRSLFFESTREILQALNEDALALEKSPQNADLVRDLRRSVHTLKGDSAACGYKDLSELAHAVEDVLTPEVAARSGLALVELVLIAADTFDSYLTSLRGTMPPPSTAPIYERIQQLRSPAKPAPAVAEFSWSAAELDHIDQVARGQRVVNLSLRVDDACPMRGAAVQMVRNALQNCGTLLALHPADGVSDALQTIEAAVATPLDDDVLGRKLRIPTVITEVTISPVTPRQAQTAPVAAPAPEPATETTTERKPRDERPFMAPENVLRVEVERVDAALDLVGELIIAKSMMQEVLAEMSRHIGNGPLRTRGADALTQQSQILNKLQRAVMKIRMVPVEQMFRRLPRVARDTAKAVGRDVNVIIEGGATDLDKSILDALSEPMMHLLRNAIDHGIEPPAERVAAGKPEQGTIRLDAYHQGNQVVIEISDDGRGIDVSRVVASAVERGLIKSDQAAHLPESEALDLIFQAGVSTATQITEVSGRGVGMDVVKSVIDRLKGTVNVRTVPGQGTTFRLKMPLTLAIIKALLFRVSERLYAVPLTNVLEILRAKEDEVHQVDGQEVLPVRQEVIPLIRLSRMHPGGTRRPKLFVVIINLGERKCGLVVDRLIGEQELVIKALDETMIRSDLVSGASILGDGRVVLVLSVADVVDKLGRGQVVAPRQESEAGL